MLLTPAFSVFCYYFRCTESKQHTFTSFSIFFNIFNWFVTERTSARFWGEINNHIQYLLSLRTLGYFQCMENVVRSNIFVFSDIIFMLSWKNKNQHKQLKNFIPCSCWDAVLKNFLWFHFVLEFIQGA